MKLPIFFSHYDGSHTNFHFFSISFESHELQAPTDKTKNKVFLCDDLITIHFHYFVLCGFIVKLTVFCSS